MKQKILTPENDYGQLHEYLNSTGKKKILLVGKNSISKNYGFGECLRKLGNYGFKITKFTDYQPNPTYESVVKGVDLFNSEKCELIMAVGGGSAIDVAKCIKLHSNMNPGDNYLYQPIVHNDIPFIAIPTTAGTGSEATKFAVIYYNGEKQSITDESCIPQAVLMDSSFLKSLPIYQKKSTVFDALSHALESFWSLNSTEESLSFSGESLKTVMENMYGYIENDDKANANMLLASNIAGKAINISQTTAGHAMCYKLTGLFNIAHGHAAILCNRKLLPWMAENIDLCIDPRGKEHLSTVFSSIAECMGCGNIGEAAEKLNAMVDSFELKIPVANSAQYEILISSVNAARLKNNPIPLDTNTIDMLYHKILS